MEQTLELKKKIEANDLKIDRLHEKNSKLEQIENSEREKLNEIIRKFEEKWKNSKEYKKIEKNGEKLSKLKQENENLKIELSDITFENKKDQYTKILDFWGTIQGFTYKGIEQYILYDSEEWEVVNWLKHNIIELKNIYFGNPIFEYEKEEHFKIEVYEALFGLISERKDKSLYLIENIRRGWLGLYYSYLWDDCKKLEKDRIINLYVWGTEDISNNEEYKTFSKKVEEEEYKIYYKEIEEEEYKTFCKEEEEEKE